MPAQKFAVLLLLAMISYVLFDAQQYLSVGFFQSLYQQQPQITALTFFGLYVLVASFSLPGAALLTMIGGIIFDFWIALLLVSFASTIGATIAFLLSRYLLRDWVQAKFSRYLTTINQGVAEDGGFYLFSLRLIPLFPFWAINLVMGLMPIKATTFYWVSQVGMLAGTAVYVNAGASIGAVESC
jgi:uncharacterized membrane protein YdjX (TVP38/TMEM64 family)